MQSRKGGAAIVESSLVMRNRFRTTVSPSAAASQVGLGASSGAQPLEQDVAPDAELLGRCRLEKLGLIRGQAARLNEGIDPDEIERRYSASQFANDSPAAPKIAV